MWDRIAAMSLSLLAACVRLYFVEARDSHPQFACGPYQQSDGTLLQGKLYWGPGPMQKVELTKTIRQKETENEIERDDKCGVQIEGLEAQREK